MRLESDRRTFVRQVIAGAPALAGVAAFSGSVHAAPVLSGSRSVHTDLAIESVLQRLAGLHNELVRRRPTADDARAAIEYLQQLGTLRQQAGRDVELSRTLHGLVSYVGREPLLTLTPDPRTLQAGLTYYGLDAGRLTIDAFGPVSYEARAAALDTLLDRGVASYYMDPAYALDMLTFAVSAGGTSWICAMFDDMTTMIEALAAVLCLAAQFIPVIAPECFAASTVLATLKVLELLAQC
jgi:hypothetical protein